MKNIILELFKNKRKCSHKNALLTSNQGYCPDCGEFLVKNYYLVRCSCCDNKREAKLSWGEILPKEKYCSNCGSKEFYIEKTQNLNFIDANYAIYLKEKDDEYKDLHSNYQVWVEKETLEIKRLTAN